MRKDDNDAYAIPFPFNQSQETFSIPNGDAVSHFFGTGEAFHARTKIPAEETPDQEIRGIACYAVGKVPNRLQV